MEILFYASGGIGLAGTFLALTRRNAFHALLYLVVAFLALALVFLSLGAAFAAVLEVLVYAGAIMVLFVFVVMMLNLGGEAARREGELLRPGAWIGPALLALLLAVEFGWLLCRGELAPGPAAAIGPRRVGLALLGPYLLGVELASFILLAGLVGGCHLGRNLRVEGGEG